MGIFICVHQAVSQKPTFYMGCVKKTSFGVKIRALHEILFCLLIEHRIETWCFCSWVHKLPLFKMHFKYI
jgi:hypothetical protein